MKESWFYLAGLFGMKPTRVANAYFVMTFLSINLGGPLMIYSLLVALSTENRFVLSIFVGVDGADWNFY